MCKITKAVCRREGLERQFEPTQPHQLSTPDAAPTSVKNRLQLTHSPLFYFSGGGDYMFFFFLFLFIIIFLCTK